MKELLIFDLDGTLIDSKRDLADSVNAMRVHLGEPPLADETVYSYVGNGAPVLVRRALPGRPDEEIQRGLGYFLEYYRDHMLDATTLYPGVREALDELLAANVKMAVLTNKPVRFSEHLIKGLGLDGHFFRIYGGNSFEEKKPHPIGIELLMEESGIRSRRYDHGRRQRGRHHDREKRPSPSLRRHAGVSNPKPSPTPRPISPSTTCPNW